MLGVPIYLDSLEEADDGPELVGVPDRKALIGELFRRNDSGKYTFEEMYEGFLALLPLGDEAPDPEVYKGPFSIVHMNFGASVDYDPDYPWSGLEFDGEAATLEDLKAYCIAHNRQPLKMVRCSGPNITSYTYTSLT